MNRQYNHISDNELLQKYYSDQNQEWLGILLERYTMLLFGVCMKYLKDENEARDCVQQVFLKVLTEASKYKVEYFKSWIYIIAKNHCLMRIRNRNIKRSKELDESVTIVAEEVPKNEIEEKELTLNVMESALEELNPEQKQCVTLFYLEKKSYQQITDITGYSMLQVKSYIQNGKRNLKILIEKKLKQNREQQNER